MRWPSEGDSPRSMSARAAADTLRQLHLTRRQRATTVAWSHIVRSLHAVLRNPLHPSHRIPDLGLGACRLADSGSLTTCTLGDLLKAGRRGSISSNE